jgi:hypothetical protein
MLMAGNISKMPIDVVGSKDHYFRYTTVKGIFLQDEIDTDDSTFDPVGWHVS